MTDHSLIAERPCRPDLPDNWVIGMSVGLLILVATFLLVKPWLPPTWLRPGTPPLQTAAILGSLCLLVPFVFAGGKRSGLSRVPNKLFIAHVVASMVGMALIAIHALSRLDGPPLILLACLILLLASGVMARVRVSRMMAATLGTKMPPFRTPDPQLKDQLRNIISQKTALLKRLDPTANEAVFSVTLRHWLSSPRDSLAYHRLTRQESGLIGERQSVPFIQAWWRPFHLALAWVFLAGLLVHIVVVTWFAGYAADAEIYWWHLADWGRTWGR